MNITSNRVRRSLILAGILTAVAVPAMSVAGPFDDRRRDRDRDHDHDRRETRESRGMVRLGSKTVDGRHDRDTIDVNTRGRFRSILIRVTDSPARLENVVVHFENGEKFRPSLRRTFGKGSFSQTIDLPGNHRDIDKVTFQYSDLRRGDDAEVVLFGIR
jgi:hypothetical protein